MQIDRGEGRGERLGRAPGRERERGWEPVRFFFPRALKGGGRKGGGGEERPVEKEKTGPHQLPLVALPLVVVLRHCGQDQLLSRAG